MHSVCLPVHALTLVNNFQMSSNLCMLFISDIAMDRTENGIYTTYGLSTETHKSFPMHNGLWGGVVVKAYFNMFTSY